MVDVLHVLTPFLSLKVLVAVTVRITSMSLLTYHATYDIARVYEDAFHFKIRMVAVGISAKIIFSQSHQKALSEETEPHTFELI